LTAHVDIDARLDNWSRWLRSLERNRGSCITGIICANMREAALGNVWSGHDAPDPIDTNDAQRIERAMRSVIKPKRDALRLHYVEGARWQIICRRAHVRVSREHFDMVMRQAREAVEWQVNKEAA
jgi:DNA-directed RNA polymerase specialized sigma24 family protein